MSEFDPKSFPFPPEWLAGHADGELAPEEAAQVERFLAEHPEFLRELHQQVEMSFRSEEPSRRIAPPIVSESGWTRVFVGIEMGLEPPSTIQPSIPSRGRATLAALAGLVVLASLLLLLLPTPRVTVRETVVRDAIFDEPIRLASNDEIRIVSLDETAADGLVVGHHPLSLNPLVLASFDEVDLHGIGPDGLGEYPELQMTPHGASTPMIWARADLRVAKEP
jgi:anti-sigma factor RsiW